MRNFFVCGIGASAGGHDAIAEFFKNIPPDPGVAFVVVTHLLRSHKSTLDRIIAKYTSLKVVRIKEIQQVQPNVIYVMPEGVNVVIKGNFLRLSRRSEYEIKNEAIDTFFKSLAENWKEKAIGIIFSGMGSDGASGAVELHKYGGQVLVQDPHSTPFNSMPWAAIRKDSPDEVLTPAKLGLKLLEILREKELNQSL
jgi:two-component system, chemotaxis family, protein-glutamate methylesterase/glutaminase